MAKDIAKSDIYQSAALVIPEESLEHMSEMEFDFMETCQTIDECKHEKIVKLYYAGMHSNYGCVTCKKKSLDLKDFV
ncbi:MAG: hypothetical protein Q4E53_13775 [Eubacteriales bacterium]|nr:hypothetical protein [Eubacteriales bacterium]